MKTAVLGTALAGMCLAAASVPAQDHPSVGALESGAFVDIGYLGDFNAPDNHVFRHRGTTPRVDELDLNMAAVFVRKPPAPSSRWGFEATALTGEDSKTFAFSATAPNIAGADWLRHLGPTSVSCLLPVGSGLAVQGGIFNSLIGYDSLFAKDNIGYTRPWGADFTPYLMMGVNAAYPMTSQVTATLFVVNGYFHLAHANDAPTLGGQIAFDAGATRVRETVLLGSHQPDTAFAYWRTFSDTIVERKLSRVTAAIEYQLGAERVASSPDMRAWWMAAQMPLEWRLSPSLSASVRPEFCWDRDGRWTGASQSVKALAASAAYRRAAGPVQTTVKIEIRIDDARGAGGGFFTGGDSTTPPALTPRQTLAAVGVMVSWTATPR